ncbi:hypothetical protein TNCV_3021111 [Trichonephila clavipes]|nr:hypothetical protein TNCV_3021111 [Trichonephila clavipes]
MCHLSADVINRRPILSNQKTSPNALIYNNSRNPSCVRSNKVIQSVFFQGYVKSLVYADKPQTLDHLEDNIRRVIADIRKQILKNVIENWTSRLDYIRASRGSPMPQILFKM